MAVIRRYRKKGQFPIGATGVPGDARALSAEQGAIAQTADLGGLLATRVGQRIYRADTKAQTVEAIANIETQWNAEFDSYDTRPDHTTYKKTFDKTAKNINKIAESATNNIAKRDIGNYITANTPRWEAARNKAVLGRMQAGLLDSRDRLVGSIKDLDLSDPSALAEAEGRIGEAGNLMREHGGFSKAAVENWTEAALEVVENQVIYQEIESIKPNLVAAIAKRNNKEDGYEALNVATAQLVKDGILTEPEAAETNKKLGDWIDNYVSGRIKAAKNADAVAAMQSYREFSKPILNGEMTYDDTGNFRETRRPGEQISDAERWRKYIKGSYKDAPTKNTPDGHTISFNAVYDAATLQLSPKEGYDVLLEARFVDGSITNEQFEWAVGKIENPYPKHVLEDLKASLKSNLEDYNRLFKSDNERNKEVNESLISWADEQIEKEKVPSKKEMFAMSSAFRAGGGQPYDIGAVIERGGRQWEIVGFDEDGEALVEEIP